MLNEPTPGDSSELSQPAPANRAPPTDVLRRGMSLGRYVVLEPLGHGGMGVVYAAFDPQLDRKVALKLMRPDLRYGSLEDRRTRLLKEAQVLARLSHPNVVAVHDVGTFADQVFIAMEFMSGGSLSEWLKAPRAWKDVLARFLEAGAGLAAAHRAGIVHRDFKPDNVLLDAAGVAHVTDFGLAWQQDTEAPRGGGTGSYMAPEQRNREPVTAAADQFSFCVSLYRALAKAPPYEPPEKLDGGPRPFPPGTDAPAWLRRVLARGLDARPAARFPSMDALLDALRADPTAHRRRGFLAAGVFLSLGGAAAASGWALTRETPRERAARECRDTVSGQASALWSREVASSARAAFVAADPTGGATTFELVSTRLGPEVDAWERLASEQCTLEAQTPASAAVARCLTVRRRVLGSLGELFRTADRTVTENAVTAVALELLPVESCRSVEPPPTAAGPAPLAPSAEEGGRLRSELAAARVMKAAGHFDEAIAAGQSVVDAAHRAGLGRVEAEAEVLVGQLYAELRRVDAEETLKGAIAHAEAASADEERALAWMTLVGWYADRGRFEPAHFAAAQADAILQRLGRPDLLEAQRLNQLGQLLARQDDESAGDVLARALALRRKHLPEDHPLVLRSLMNWANQLPPAEARPVYDDILQRRRRALGDAHPEVAVAELNLGDALRQDGQCADAVPHLERAVAIRAPRADVDPARLGRARAVLARALECVGRLEDAAREEAQGVELLKKGGATDSELGFELKRLLALSEQLGRPRPELDRLREDLRHLGE